ncbi:hypothetical protein ACRAWD_04350 [Caulobacter segnis]
MPPASPGGGLDRLPGPSFNARFAHFIHVDDIVRLPAWRTTDGRAARRAVGRWPGRRHARAVITLGPPDLQAPRPLSAAPAERLLKPIERPLDALSGLAGRRRHPRRAPSPPLPGASGHSGGRCASMRWGALGLGGHELSACIRCSAALTSPSTADARDPVSFAVTNISEATRLVEMKVDGGGLSGVVKAFHRPAANPARDDGSAAAARAGRT